MKKRLTRICAAAALFVCAFAVDLLDLPYGEWAALALYTAAYLTAGARALVRAARNIAHGQVFDENFLMSLATIGAYAIGEYREAVAVMLLYQIGEAFEQYAVGKSRKSIAELMNLRPDHAVLLREDGSALSVEPTEVRRGDVILVAAGERIPLDGEIVQGESSLDSSALTGESLPRDVVVGDAVLSGCVNLTGVLHVRVTKEYGESTATKILELVENASSRKSRSESFITRFAAYYTPAVVIGAALLALIPPLALPDATFGDWFYRALNFLIVSCPCALVISVPLSFFGGIGGASRQGILVKGSNYLEALANVEIAAFDKTGTLTQGRFVVKEVYSVRSDAESLLALTAAVEKYSNHPISQSICAACADRASSETRKYWEERIGANVKEVAGHGMEASLDGRRVLIGNAALLQSAGIDGMKENVSQTDGETVAYVAVGDEYLGCITLADAVREDAAAALRRLRECGVRRTVMLTGDSEAVGKRIAEQLSLDDYRAELLPGDKLETVEKLLEETKGKGKLLFVGDGINDAPALARADIGVAMGGLGQDAAIEAADVVIMTDELSRLADAVVLARKTLKIVRQNIAFALTVKGAVLLLSALGFAGLWAAVFADVGVSALAVLNAMRCGRAPRKQNLL